LLHVSVQEGYASLPNKTRTFFKVVSDQWEPEWYVPATSEAACLTVTGFEARKGGIRQQQ